MGGVVLVMPLFMLPLLCIGKSDTELKLEEDISDFFCRNDVFNIVLYR